VCTFYCSVKNLFLIKREIIIISCMIVVLSVLYCCGLCLCVSLAILVFDHLATVEVATI
jgi:hypothetical protein